MVNLWAYSCVETFSVHTSIV